MSRRRKRSLLILQREVAGAIETIEHHQGFEDAGLSCLRNPRAKAVGEFVEKLAARQRQLMAAFGVFDWSAPECLTALGGNLN